MSSILKTKMLIYQSKANIDEKILFFFKSCLSTNPYQLIYEDNSLKNNNTVRTRKIEPVFF